MAHPTALLRSVAAGSLLTLLFAATVAGYAGQVAATITATSDDDAACGAPFTVSALIEDASNAPIEGQPVEWSFGTGALPGDAILDRTTTTDASGIASTRVELACSEAHQVTLLIRADDVEGSMVLGTLGDSLPRTDTTPLTAETSLPGILLAALAVLAGSGAILHRFAAARR